MSNELPNGGSAFPQTETADGNPLSAQHGDEYGGMSLRDYFAAKAMQAMVSHERNIIAMCAENGAREQICEDAYKVADAMLKERSKCSTS